MQNVSNTYGSKELQNMGVKFDVRGVPSDQPANIDDLIRSAEKKLAEKK